MINTPFESMLKPQGRKEKAQGGALAAPSLPRGLPREMRATPGEPQPFRGKAN
jgi:hypothetical protein